MPERSLIFDNDLFELLLEMPPEMKRNGRVYRKTLKKLAPAIANIANASTGVNPQIPAFLESIVNLIDSIKRRAFPSRSIFTMYGWGNFAEMLRQNDKLRIVMEKTVKDPECLDPMIFDQDRILRMLKDHVDRKADYAFLLFLLLTLGRWCKKFGPRTLPEVGYGESHERNPEDQTSRFSRYKDCQLE